MKVTGTFHETKTGSNKCFVPDFNETSAHKNAHRGDLIH